MRTNVNLWNRVPEHYYLTFFMLHGTKCKPTHFEWELFSDLFVLHRTNAFEWERFTDYFRAGLNEMREKEREGERD